MFALYPFGSTSSPRSNWAMMNHLAQRERSCSLMPRIRELRTSQKWYEVADRQMAEASSRWSAILSTISTGRAAMPIRCLSAGARRWGTTGLIDLNFGRGSRCDEEWSGRTLPGGFSAAFRDDLPRPSLILSRFKEFGLMMVEMEKPKYDDDRYEVMQPEEILDVVTSVPTEAWKTMRNLD
jgi:hypothetical protein